MFQPKFQQQSLLVQQTFEENIKKLLGNSALSKMVPSDTPEEGEVGMLRITFGENNVSLNEFYNRFQQFASKNQREKFIQIEIKTDGFMFPVLCHTLTWLSANDLIEADWVFRLSPFGGRLMDMLVNKQYNTSKEIQDILVPYYEKHFYVKTVEGSGFMGRSDMYGTVKGAMTNCKE